MPSVASFRITTARTQNKIERITSRPIVSRALLARWPIPYTKYQVFPLLQGITIDGAGNIYVIDETDGQILKLSPAGALVARVGSLAGASGQAKALIDKHVEPVRFVEVTLAGQGPCAHAPPADLRVGILRYGQAFGGPTFGEL